jgi:hypothetical protein
MGFQDNSGDIILDMVLTDYGRQKLAKGKGLGVEAFGLGDEEINYRLFDKTAASYQQDLSILQTPVLEAFTNNQSSLKSKLITYSNDNLFYLPILKLNTLTSTTKQQSSLNTFLICVDKNTETNNNEEGSYSNATTAVGLLPDQGPIAGIVWGATPQSNDNHIRIDAGIDNVATLNIQDFASGGDESFTLTMDGRLGRPVTTQAAGLNPIATDDDGIDTYILKEETTPGKSFVLPGSFFTNTSIAGFKHNSIRLKIQTTANLQSSNYYFDLLGNTGLSLSNASGGSTTVKFIDSIVTITGQTTGYSISIPIRYIKI